MALASASLAYRFAVGPTFSIRRHAHRTPLSTSSSPVCELGPTLAGLGRVFKLPVHNIQSESMGHPIVAASSATGNTDVRQEDTPQQWVVVTLEGQTFQFPAEETASNLHVELQVLAGGRRGSILRASDRFVMMGNHKVAAGEYVYRLALAIDSMNALTEIPDSSAMIKTIYDATMNRVYGGRPL